MPLSYDEALQQHDSKTVMYLNNHNGQISPLFHLSLKTLPLSPPLPSRPLPHLSLKALLNLSESLSHCPCVVAFISQVIATCVC